MQGGYAGVREVSGVLCLVSFLWGGWSSPVRAAEDAGSGHEVMQSFVKKERAVSEHVLIAEKERRQILFIMGRCCW